MKWLTARWLRQTAAFFVAGFILLIVLDELAQPMLETSPEKQNIAIQHLSIVEPQAVNEQVFIHLLASVEPAKTTEIASTVSGKVIGVYPDFRQGHQIAKSLPLIKIDDREYKLRVAQAKASHIEAELNLKHYLSSFEPNSLRVQLAKSQVDAASKSLEQARYDLKNTVITMPVEGELTAVNSNLGEYVSVGQSIATGLPNGNKRIQVAVSEQLFNRLDLTEKASVAVRAPDSNLVWKAQIQGSSQHTMKMQRLLYLTVSSEESHGLLHGAKVHVELPIKQWQHTVRLPESALTSKSELYYVDRESLLQKTVLKDYIRQGGWVYFEQVALVHQVLSYPRKSLLVGTRVNNSQMRLAQHGKQEGAL